MVPSFVIPPGVSPDEVARKRAISEKLMMQGLQSQPKTIGDGLGSIADMLLARGYHEASKRDSQRMNELGQRAVGMWTGEGGEPAQPATPQESYMPDGVSVAQMAPPAGAQGGNVPGVMPNVQPYNPQPQQQPNQTGIHVDQMAARRAFRNLTDDELLSNLMNPQLVQATEWLNPEIPKIAREELSRRWDYLTEQQKQEFQLHMQDRGFDQQTQQQLRGFEHDRGMVGLRSRSELESEAIKQGYGSVEEMQAAGGTVQAQKFRLENQDAQRKRELSEQQKQDRADLLTQEIDRALSTMNESMTTGMFAPLANLPGTDARSLAARLDTIKANIGFDQLNAMRASSPTGGALGNVTERELAFLQAVAGSLDQAQNAQELQDNLNRLWNSYMDVIHGPGNGPERRPLSFERNQDQSGGWTVEQVD